MRRRLVALKPRSLLGGKDRRAASRYSPPSRNALSTCSLVAMRPSLTLDRPRGYPRAAFVKLDFGANRKAPRHHAIP